MADQCTSTLLIEAGRVQCARALGHDKMHVGELNRDARQWSDADAEQTSAALLSNTSAPELDDAALLTSYFPEHGQLVTIDAAGSIADLEHVQWEHVLVLDDHIEAVSVLDVDANARVIVPWAAVLSIVLVDVGDRDD